MSSSRPTLTFRPNTTYNNNKTNTNNITTNNTVTITNKPKIPKLNDEWTLYYHLPHDRNWKLDSYVIIMNCIDTIEKSAVLMETLPDLVIKESMLFLMRRGVTPLWEDERNRNGGSLSFKVPKKRICEVFRRLAYGVLGEDLFHDPSYMKKVTGITVSPKVGNTILKIWLEDDTIQTIDILKNPPLYDCIHKKHYE